MTRLTRVLAALTVVAVLASLFVVLIARARRTSRFTACAGNLRVLWSLQASYTYQKGSKQISATLGSEFWRELEKTSPPMLDEMEKECLLCPVKGYDRVGDIDYFGPGAPVHQLAGGAPVACDDPRNHGGEGGNVLRKSGDVLLYTPADFDAMFRTHPTPPRR